MKQQFGAFNFNLERKVVGDAKRQKRQFLRTNDEGLRKLKRSYQGLASSTRKAYRSQLSRFDHSRRDQRTTDEAVAAYVDHLHEIGRAPGVIKLAICAIRLHPKALHKPDPVRVETKNALKKSRREGAGRGKGPAPGLTLEQVESIIRQAESDGDLWGIRDAAMIAVQFYTGLRIVEFAALQASDIEEPHPETR